MRKTLSCLCAALAIVVTGCVTPIPSIQDMDVATLASKTKVTRDNFKKTTTAETISALYFDSRSSIDMSSYWLEARLTDGESEPTYVVVIETFRSSSRGWAHWREAFDEEGNKFSLTNELIEVKDTAPLIDKHALQERYLAIVTRDYLQRMMSKPLSWRLYGQKGEETFRFNANLVEGFFVKVDETLVPKTAGKSGEGL